MIVMPYTFSARYPCPFIALDIPVPRTYSRLKLSLGLTVKEGDPWRVARDGIFT